MVTDGCPATVAIGCRVQGVFASAGSSCNKIEEAFFSSSGCFLGTSIGHQESGGELIDLPRLFWLILTYSLPFRCFKNVLDLDYLT